MNVRKRTSKHQQRLLAAIASGRTIIRWDAASDLYVKSDTYSAGARGEPYVFASRRQRKPWSLCGCHAHKAFAILMQRGWLVEDADGRIVLAPSIRRQFGSASATPSSKRHIVMSRTRAARVQT